MSPQALGQHGRKNVCFLQVGYGNENIRPVYVLLQEESLIRCVAVQHYGFIEFLRDRSSAVVVSLDEFDLVRMLERLREPDTNVTPAGDNDASDALIKLAHLAQHSPNVLSRSDKKNLIVFFYDSVPIRDVPLPTSINGDDATLHIRDMLGKLSDWVANQCTTFVSARRDQSHLPIGELENLERPGEVDELLYMLGYQLFRADNEINSQPPLKSA